MTVEIWSLFTGAAFTLRAAAMVGQSKLIVSLVSNYRKKLRRRRHSAFAPHILIFVSEPRTSHHEIQSANVTQLRNTREDCRALLLWPSIFRVFLSLLFSKT